MKRQKCFYFNDDDEPKKKKFNADLDSLILDTNPDCIDHTSSPRFRYPTEVGFFSLDSESNFRDDNSSLTYLYGKRLKNKKLNLDLKVGYDTFVGKKENDIQGLGDIFKWISLHPPFNTLTKKGEKLKSLQTDFICWRGLLRKFLCTPYELNENWLIIVRKFKGTHYLVEIKTDEKKQEEREQTTRLKEMSYWGFKFEQYMTTEKPDGKPVTNVPVNNHKQFVSVFLEEKLIAKKIKMTRYKLLKWWSQSILIGVKKIVAGFRDDDGIVREVTKLYTKNIPDQCQSIRNAWNPKVCFNFLDKLLDFIRENVTDENRSYMFEFEPGKKIVKCFHLHQDQAKDGSVTASNTITTTATETSTTVTATTSTAAATTEESANVSTAAATSDTIGNDGACSSNSNNDNNVDENSDDKMNYAKIEVLPQWYRDLFRK
ncbi:hypothetical protein HELRODRAFT_169832 [Helobdella robusta]|uniref:Decapping nuclease n=1 Tax=Helobdella robusta TaxID=6412 RepID=T1F2C9_HELRO|nr:hypothetical protein HELRODRAFT_169832 [Helobdella robusta]ESO08100.1 hypothetical protein HELRODRAFT_169832 [Helobdella robusta]